MCITKKISLDSPLYMKLPDQEHKFPICVTRTGYPETKNHPNSNFSNNFFLLESEKERNISLLFLNLKFE